MLGYINSGVVRDIVVLKFHGHKNKYDFEARKYDFTATP